MTLRGKHIIVGITGSIAAYKAAMLVRLLVKEGAEVKVLMTQLAKKFITPLTMSTLSRNPVLVDFFDPENGAWNSHVDLGLWADALLIAPATANTIAKMATGTADNLLLTTFLSARCPIFAAPAMDVDMFQHAATTQNLQTLQKRGVHIIEPSVGELASGLDGKGRMEDPEKIVQYVADALKTGDCVGKKILVTAGPTYEPIDPVRFVGNYSSGRMGYALAEELAQRGAEVMLVSGPTALSVEHPSICRMDVTTADEMYRTVTKLFPEIDAAIMAAAVADFTPAMVQQVKIKDKELDLKLVPTKDIAAELGAAKRPGQILAGFALETNNEKENAMKKLKQKNLDFIVLNSLNDTGAGFGHTTNKITIIDKDGRSTDFGLKPKDKVAKDIVNKLVTFWNFCCLFLLMTTSIGAQELRCAISLNTQQIQGSNRSVTEALQTALNEFVNTRVWTNHVFTTEERIECSMMLNITSLVGNEFSGTMTVQSRRPVYNSVYPTTMLNFQDRDLKFSFVEGQPLDFSDVAHLSNLTSIIAFYVYIILGLDYDSFSLNGGTPFFQKAETIVTNAQQSSERGWKAYEGNYRNRYWLTQNLLDDRYRGVREFTYKYYRMGLDRMSSRPNEARTDIADNFKLLQDVYRRKPDPYMFLLQVVFDAKSNEWVDIFTNGTPDEKTRVVKLLKEIDPSNISKYDKISQ